MIQPATKPTKNPKRKTPISEQRLQVVDGLGELKVELHQRIDAGREEFARGVEAAQLRRVVGAELLEALQTRNDRRRGRAGRD